MAAAEEERTPEQEARRVAATFDDSTVDKWLRAGSRDNPCGAAWVCRVTPYRLLHVVGATEMAEQLRRLFARGTLSNWALQPMAPTRTPLHEYRDALRDGPPEPGKARGYNQLERFGFVWGEEVAATPDDALRELHNIGDTALAGIRAVFGRYLNPDNAHEHAHHEHDEQPVEPATAAGPLPPYTDASRARVAVSLAAQEIANLAASQVPIEPGELHSTGQGGTAGVMVDIASILMDNAEDLLRLVVVYEAVAGTSWEQIGTHLQLTAQQARQRYGGAVAEFRDALLNPTGVETDGHTFDRLPAGATNPDAWVPQLDAWLHQIQDDTSEIGHYDVAGGLARMQPQLELMRLHQQRAALIACHQMVPIADELAILERETTLTEQLAHGTDQHSLANQTARYTRARLDQLRAAYPGTAPENP